MTPPTTRAARRAATAEKILDAARAEFGEHGLEAATVRGIATRAGVDPSLVLQHYGSKAELFARAIQLRAVEAVEAGEAGADVATHLDDVLAARLAEPPPQTRALLRSMLTAPEATAVMKQFLDDRAAEIARDLDGPDAQLRAALTVTNLLGLTLARHFLQLDGLADIGDRQREEVVGPWLRAALDPAGPDRPDSADHPDGAAGRMTP